MSDLLKALIEMSLSMRIELSCGLQSCPQQVVRRYHWDTIYQRARNLLYAARSSWPILIAKGIDIVA